MYNTDLPTRAELPSSLKLMQSTLMAAIVALTLLITVVMPSEYAIDPTGIGRVLGLKQMGEIKTQLAEEAESDQQAVVNIQAPVARPATVSTVPDNPPVIAQNSAPERDTPSVIPSQETKAAGVQRNQMVITLKPNEAAEIKLDMRKDAQVSYQWTSSGPVTRVARP